MLQRAQRQITSQPQAREDGKCFVPEGVTPQMTHPLGKGRSGAPASCSPDSEPPAPQLRQLDPRQALLLSVELEPEEGSQKPFAQSRLVWGEGLGPLASVSLYGKETESPELVSLFTVDPEPLPLLAFGLYYPGPHFDSPNNDSLNFYGPFTY